MDTVVRSEELTQWLGRLKDQTARAKIIIRIKRLAAGNPGDVKHFDGIAEMRIDHGPGYRVYFVKDGDMVYLLLIGGNKSTQKRDIEKAKKLLAAR